MRATVKPYRSASSDRLRVKPLPLRSPVRSLVWIRGRLRRVLAPLMPALLDVVAADDADLDVRLPFGAPVADTTGLSRAIRVLIGCPFRNGLRARG